MVRERRDKEREGCCSAALLVRREWRVRGVDARLTLGAFVMCNSFLVVCTMRAGQGVRRCMCKVGKHNVVARSGALFAVLMLTTASSSLSSRHRRSLSMHSIDRLQHDWAGRRRTRGQPRGLNMSMSIPQNAHEFSSYDAETLLEIRRLHVTYCVAPIAL